MSKIKNFIEGQKTDLKGLLFKYTFSLISAALISVLLCIEIELDKRSDLLSEMELFLMVFLAGALFIETYFVHKGQEKNWKKLSLLYISDAVIAFIWTVIGHFDEEIAGLFDYPNIYYLNITKILVAYIYVLVALTIYKLVKKSGLSFDIYLARVIFGLLKTWGLFFVIYLAIIMLLGIFNSLIMDIEYWDILENVSVLLCGFVCFPYSLLCITDTKEENSRFTKGLINFALMPAVIVAFAIIYLYIIKIILSFKLPSNEVFNICLMVFVFGGPVWFICNGFIKEKALTSGESTGLYGKIVKNIKYAYVPFIILEIISIGIRIYHYGLTSQRYLAIVAILFQIVYVAWDYIGKVLKKELKDEGLILVGLGITVFTSLCPILNMDRLPSLIQQARFEKAIEEERYGDASEIYFYLDRDDYGEKYLDEELTVEERKEYKQMFYDFADEDEKDSYKYVEYYSAYVSNYQKEEGLDIAGYTHLYKFDFNGHYDKVYKEEDLTAFTICYGDDFEVANVDIASVMFGVIFKKDNIKDDNSMDYIYIKVSDNCCVVVEHIYFNYNSYTEEFSSVSIDGYVLTNEGAHNGQ